MKQQDTDRLGRIKSLAQRRDEARKRAREACLEAKPGRVEELWDNDEITLGMAVQFLAWREEAGLEP